MLWKIFSGVWLYGWKCYFPTNFSHGNSTHSSKLRRSKAITTKTPPSHHHNNKNQNHTETQIKPRKKNHNPIKLREEGREDDRFWGRGRSVLGCDGSGFAIGDDESVLQSRFAIWVRDRGSRSRTDSKSDGEPIVPSLFFLSLSLSLCARARLPLPQLSLCFPENFYLKVK